MKTEKNKEMLKYFATILRKRAKDESETVPAVDPAILYFLSRKDLVAIVNEMYKGALPGKPDVATLENKELLEFIKDDLFIVAYMLNNWRQETLKHPTALVTSELEEGSNDAD
ncbi:MAG: hypothetical protein KG003_15080 [Bacteroidetes bacterium]|nr:hypothetical protein [Bacteroidota bacterium]